MISFVFERLDRLCIVQNQIENNFRSYAKKLKQVNGSQLPLPLTSCPNVNRLILRWVRVVVALVCMLHAAMEKQIVITYWRMTTATTATSLVEYCFGVDVMRAGIIMNITEPTVSIWSTIFTVTDLFITIFFPTSLDGRRRLLFAQSVSICVYIWVRVHTIETKKALNRNEHAHPNGMNAFLMCFCPSAAIC